MSGFAIFSVLGYMSQKQGVDIDTVADSGLNINLLSAVSLWEVLLDIFPVLPFHENEKNVNNQLFSIFGKKITSEIGTLIKLIKFWVASVMIILTKILK